MKNKKNNSFLIGFVLLCFFVSNMSAQDSFGPQQGDKIVSLKFGKLKDYGEVSAYEVNRTTWNSASTISQPVMATDDANATISIIGIEAKYFIKSNMAVRLGAGGAFSGAPSQDYVKGVSVAGSEDPNSTIPSYTMLEGNTTKEMYGDLGFDYYFNTKVSRLFPFLGVEVSGVYGQMEIFDGYRGLNSDDEVIPTYDTRRGETYAFGGGLNGGVDYYISEGLFLGVEVKVASYMYTAKTIFPQPGLDPNEAYANNFSFLSQPVIKIGFKF